MRYLSAGQAAESRRAVARPVDRARVRIRFGDGDATDLRAALGAYQNDDGGYGRALEPDLRLPDSSSTATTVAFQHLRAAGADDTWPEVRRGVEYLLATWDPSVPGWHPTPPEVDDHPHAPWWTYRGPPTEFAANPGAEAYAVLLRHAALAPGAALTEIGAAVKGALARCGDEVEPHEMLCWMRLAAEAPEPLADRIVAALRRALPSVLTVDPAQWDAYAPGPLWFAATPESPLFDDVADHVAAHLDHLIARRAPDGRWLPAWTWGADPAWPRARDEWASALTVDALTSLASYGRIETA